MILRPLTNWQRCRRFGRFDFQHNPRPWSEESITIRNDWAEANINTIHSPAFERKFGRKWINIHYKASNSFVALFEAWDAAGLLAGLSTFNGSWVPRFKRGRAGGGIAALSNHSWGTAFDVDARLYPLGKPVPRGAHIRELVPLAEKLGWFWGGNFRSRPDGMHFEFTGFIPPRCVHDAADFLLEPGFKLAWEVRHCQTRLGVQPDGVIGPKTQDAAKEVRYGRSIPRLG